MKSPFLVSLFLLLSIGLSSQNDDLQAIEAVLTDYMIGGQERDGDRIAGAFHEQAMMKYLRDGEYREVNAKEFFGGAKPGAPLERTNEIVMIDVSGYAAMAKIRLTYADKMFVDYMTLMKVDGEWKIVNKVPYLKRF